MGKICMTYVATIIIKDEIDEFTPGIAPMDELTYRVKHRVSQDLHDLIKDNISKSAQIEIFQKTANIWRSDDNLASIMNKYYEEENKNG